MQFSHPQDLPRTLVPIATAFQATYAPQFLQAWLGILGAHTAVPSQQVLALALGYVNLATDARDTYDMIAEHVRWLVAQVLLPMMCFSPTDMQMWRDNPEEYVRILYDPTDVYNPRSAAGRLLAKVCDGRLGTLPPRNRAGHPHDLLLFTAGGVIGA